MKSNTDLKFQTLYISIWGWQVLAMMFFTSAVILTAFQFNPISFTFGISFFIGFVISEFMCLKRKQEFYDGIGDFS